MPEMMGYEKNRRFVVLDIMAIPLSRGLCALVDGKDYHWLMQWRWCAWRRRENSVFYAVRKIKRNGRWTTTQMQHELLKRPADMQIDHKNHCGLDNRRQNLRLCSHNQNIYNQRPTQNTSSQYKGVTLDKRTRKWIAQIMVRRKRLYLGCFKKEEDAAKTYDEAAVKFFGKFAYCNFGN